VQLEVKCISCSNIIHLQAVKHAHACLSTYAMPLRSAQSSLHTKLLPSVCGCTASVDG
jgi:hypothetical protein